MPAIHSTLWKAAQLRYHSTYFPALVQAACDIVGIDYTDTVLGSVARNPTILGRFEVTTEAGIDVSIADAMSNPDTAATLDSDITYLVTQMKEQ